jgi:hypothetical protein
MALDIDDFDKDQLADYALSAFGVQLKMTKTLDKLKDEVLLLQIQPQEKEAVIVKNPAVTHIKNLKTGHVFPWTTLLKKHLGEEGAGCNEEGLLI